MARVIRIHYLDEWLTLPLFRPLETENKKK